MKVFKGMRMNRGMSYAELIVVLSIFAIMSSIALFNYRDFQANVEIKNLTSDIALQIVQAQKDSINGVLPPLNFTPSVLQWKPAYGVYFDINTPDQFVYFVDLDQDNVCPVTNCAGEDLNLISINKATISGVEICDENDNCNNGPEALAVSFKRPNSEAILNGDPNLVTGSGYAQITVESTKGNAEGFIRIYPSGRVEVR